MAKVDLSVTPDTTVQNPTPETKHADPSDIQSFEDALRSGALQPPQVALPSPMCGFTVDTSKIFEAISTDATGGKAIDSGTTQKDPPKPSIPDPDKDSQWDFWKDAGKSIDKFVKDVKDAVDKGVKDIVEFLGSPELAKFAQVANIVFAGGLVVAAGVMAATGVGAPASIALLAIAGSAGLIMQAPGVQDKIQAGAVAVMAPVIGQENAEKLGPLVTQGVIAGTMVAMLATGGGADSVQGVVQAAKGVFDTLQNIFSGIGQAYQMAEPFLSLAGINLNPTDISNLSNLFGSMSSMVPDLSTFAQGLTQSFADFAKNPDVDGLLKLLTKSGTEIPTSILNLFDKGFVSDISALFGSIESLIKGFSANGAGGLLTEAAKFLPLLV